MFCYCVLVVMVMVFGVFALGDAASLLFCIDETCDQIVDQAAYLFCYSRPLLKRDIICVGLTQVVYPLPILLRDTTQSMYRVRGIPVAIDR